MSEPERPPGGLPAVPPPEPEAPTPGATQPAADAQPLPDPQPAGPEAPAAQVEQSAAPEAPAAQVEQSAAPEATAAPVEQSAAPEAPAAPVEPSAPAAVEPPAVPAVVDPAVPAAVRPPATAAAQPPAPAVAKPPALAAAQPPAPPPVDRPAPASAQPPAPVADVEAPAASEVAGPQGPEAGAVPPVQVEPSTPADAHPSVRAVPAAPAEPAADVPPAGEPVSLTKDVPSEEPPAGDARRLRLMAVALGVVIVLLVAASFVLLAKDRSQQDRADTLATEAGSQSARANELIALAAVQDPQGPALRAAATAVETLLSYDYATIDADFAAGQKLLTPGFAAKYGDFTTKLVRPSALQAKAKVVATLQVLAPTEATLVDRLVVLAFVDQQTTSALLTQPAVDQSRITLTLVPQKGSWLVCDLVVTGSKPGADQAAGCTP